MDPRRQLSSDLANRWLRWSSPNFDDDRRPTKVGADAKGREKGCLQYSALRPARAPPLRPPAQYLTGTLPYACGLLKRSWCRGPAHAPSRTPFKHDLREIVGRSHFGRGLLLGFAPAHPSQKSSNRSRNSLPASTIVYLLSFHRPGLWSFGTGRELAARHGRGVSGRK